MVWSFSEKEAIMILTCFLKTKRHKKIIPCGYCEGCLTKECGKCINCTDMCKFGGLGKRRKRCVSRICHSNFHDRKLNNKNNTVENYKLSANLAEAIYDCIV